MNGVWNICMSELSQLLRQLRGDEPLREAAKRAGISHTYLSQLEKGVDTRTGKTIRPSVDTLKGLAKAYKYPYSNLLEAAGYLSVKDVSSEPISTNGIARFGKLFNKFIKILKDERGISTPEGTIVIILEMLKIYAAMNGVPLNSLPEIDLSESEKEQLTKELNNIIESKSDDPARGFPKVETIAAHRTDDPMSELPPEARKSAEEFLEYIYNKYRKR